MATGCTCKFRPNGSVIDIDPNCIDHSHLYRRCDNISISSRATDPNINMNYAVTTGSCITGVYYVTEVYMRVSSSGDSLEEPTFRPFHSKDKKERRCAPQWTPNDEARKRQMRRK